jgi:hypothetical protein
MNTVDTLVNAGIILSILSVTTLVVAFCGDDDTPPPVTGILVLISLGIGRVAYGCFGAAATLNTAWGVIAPK